MQDIASPAFNVPFLSFQPSVGRRPSHHRHYLKTITSKFFMSIDSTATEPADVSRANRESEIAPVIGAAGSKKSRTQSLGGRDATSIPLPANVNQKRIYYSYLISFIVFHSLALLIFVPWLFSWTGVASLVIGSYLFGAIGIPITYHRLLTHRSFKTPKWFERFLVIIALCNGQETPARWVAWHRLHHTESDHQEDPHSPLVNFLWSHFQWLIYENTNTNKFSLYQKYAKDILADPFYMWLEKKTYAGVAIFAAHGVVVFLAAWLIGGLTMGFGMAAFQLACSVFIWGVVARIVLDVACHLVGQLAVSHVRLSEL